MAAGRLGRDLSSDVGGSQLLAGHTGSDDAAYEMETQPATQMFEAEEGPRSICVSSKKVASSIRILQEAQQTSSPDSSDDDSLPATQ